jgi:hypothetical protein
MRRWLIFCWFCVLVSCTAKDAKTTASTPQQLPQDIDALELRLDQDMMALGLSEPTLTSDPLDPTSAPILDGSTTSTAGADQPTAEVLTAKEKEKQRLFFKNRGDRDEKKAEQAQCQRTCDLVDSICDASERICQITDKLPNDPEAPKRCERAKNSCTRAKQQGSTCGCSI